MTGQVKIIHYPTFSKSDLTLQHHTVHYMQATCFGIKVNGHKML